MFSLKRVVVALTFMLSTGALRAQQLDPDSLAQQRAQEARDAAQRAAAEAEAARVRAAREKAADDRAKDLMKYGQPNEALIERQERIRQAQFKKFHTAFKEFLSARDELEQALGSKTSPKGSARKMEKSTNTFLDYVKLVEDSRPHMDFSEFKTFTPKDLSWETLTSAERIVPDLEAVLRRENSSTIDVRYLTAFSKLHKDLLRLQWLTRHLK
jgi:hypothetical protein